MTNRAAAWCATLLIACAGARGDQADPQACSPVEAADQSIAADGLEGKYTLRLVSTHGVRRGATTEGHLELLPQDNANESREPSNRSKDSIYTFPQYGTLAVDLTAVGAVAPGDPASGDPSSPGVLVIQAPGRVLLRVGSEANHQGMRRFDGAFTVLQIHEVNDWGFVGAWRSGVGLQQSSGHFCAVRAT